MNRNKPVPAKALPLTLGVTGASGLIYAVRALKFLLEAQIPVELVASRATYQVWKAEQNLQMPGEPDAQAEFWRAQAGVPQQGSLRCHPWGDVGATIASGSFRTLGMVILPCSMSTVGKLAAGLSSDLLERAADVQLKERQPLVLVPRETPFSLIHLRISPPWRRPEPTLFPPSPPGTTSLRRFWTWWTLS